MSTVLNILIVVFGVIGFTFLGVRDYPAIDPPNISVSTAYSGANPDIIESQITEPLEKAINGIPGIKNITSSSQQGSSNINVEFDLNVDLEAAANDVRDKVNGAVRSLPQDIDAPPVVTKADANADAIITMTVQSNTRNQLEVTDYAENVLVEKLQTINGVSSIQVWGEKKYAMRLWLDPAKMSAYLITPKDIQTALNRESVELPAGKIAGNATELTIRTLGRLETEDDFNNMIIKTVNGSEIRLKDIGEAVLGPEDEETGMKESGIPMIGLALVPLPGSNYVSIAKEFYKKLDELKNDVPPDIKLNIALDQTEYIKKSISEVEETIIIAFVLVVLIIYLFFRDWVIAIRPLIDIPVSLVGAFFIMYISGFTINILTLLGIVLATGLVVDDGIVVTENIFKKMEAGMNKWQAAKEGSKEIYQAVIATSITLAVIFLPIIFLQGFVGRLFREFGIVVAGAVLISAFVSLTLTPVLNVKLTRDHKKRTWFYRVTEPFFTGMETGYNKSLKAFMRVRWVSFIIVVACFAIIYFIGLNLQSELAPLEDRSQFRVSVTTPEGTSFDYMDHYMDRLGKFVRDSVPEKRTIMTITAFGSRAGSVNNGIVRVTLVDPQERTRTQQQIVDVINRNLRRFPDGRTYSYVPQTISTTKRGGLPVQFVIQNIDFEKLAKDLPKFMDAAGKSPVFQGLDVDLKFNKPELRITVDRLKASAMGVSVDDVSQALQVALSNGRMAYFLKSGKQYQVMGQVVRSDRDDPTDLKNLYVTNNKGEIVSLDNVVNIQESSTPPTIYHFNRFKSATISAGLAPGKTIGDGIKEMQTIAKQVLDESFSTALAGSSRDFAESSGNTSFAFLLALGLIFLVLAAQFESFVDPFVIMFTVPLAIAGAVLSLWIFHQTLNIFSEIGMIMLIGLVTKNGILIVEFANQKRRAGMVKKEAVVEAATARLRPILMTSLAMSLGALPLALSLGAAATSRVPLGVVIVGGIMFSLILTLYVIPAMYSYLSSKKKKSELDDLLDPEHAPHVEHAAQA